MEIKLSQIIFQMINFGVVFGAITYLLYKPISKMLEERADKVEKAQIAADESMREREEIEKLKKQQKLEAEKQASKILEEAKDDAVTKKKILMKQAKDEADAEKAKLLKAWEQEKQTMVGDMQKDFEKAVFAVSEKLIGSIDDKAKHAKLIDQSIKELAQTN